MEPNLYHLRGATGDWPDRLNPSVFCVRIVQSTKDKAIEMAKVRLASDLAGYGIDHAWLKNDDGWTIWTTADIPHDKATEGG